MRLRESLPSNGLLFPVLKKFQRRDVAADWGGARRRYWFTREHCVQDIAEIVHRRLLAGAADRLVFVIDSAAIGDFAAGPYDDDFGGHLRAGGLDEFVVGVNDRGITAVVVFRKVPDNGCWSESWVDVVKRAFGFSVVGFTNVADLLDIAIGNRAIVGDEKDDGHFTGFGEERALHLAADIADQNTRRHTHRIGWRFRLGSSGCETDEQRQ